MDKRAEPVETYEIVDMVCSVSLCGRDGEEMWMGAPLCREHHEDMVEIRAVREEREHEDGTCACSTFEPNVEACRFYQRQYKERI